MVPRRALRAKAGRSGALLLLAFSQIARAAEPKLQGIGETSLGYTDNFRTTPDSPLLGGAPRSRGFFVSLSPGVLLAYETQRNLQRIGYRYQYDLFFAEPSSSGSSNQLDYQGFFELSKRTTLLLGASLSESDRYAAVAFATPGSSVVTALPAGAGAFVQGGASESFNFDLGPGWRAWQGGNVLFETPILHTVAPQTSEVAARSGAERNFASDAAGLEARADYTVVKNAVRPDGTPAGVEPQLVAGGVALWRHDWGQYLTSSAEAGAARVQRFNTGRGFWSPTGAALLAYATQTGEAQLSYAHSISTNALLGQSTLADEVRLRGALPLTSNPVVLLAVTAGYQRGRLIDENAELAAHVNVVLGDVALGWQATRSLQVALRYQHIEQMSDALAPPLPLSFVQNNVLLGAIFKFPPDRDMPAPYRAPQRVDRTDEIREGVPAANGLEHETEIPSR
ncbi:MAG TPA: hypothetical protein VGM29_06250 [Polyangiaceae bacterium]